MCCFSPSFGKMIHGGNVDSHGHSWCPPVADLVTDSPTLALFDPRCGEEMTEMKPIALGSKTFGFQRVAVIFHTCDDDDI
jgi:hypothetical protein